LIRKFSKFFKLTKDKSTWESILEQHEEATLKSVNSTDENEESEVDASLYPMIM
jgi:hypothetical protein